MKKFFSETLFPWACDLALNKFLLQDKRKALLENLNSEGEQLGDIKILEIGIGTGLNLECYPKEVKLITAIDPNPGMARRLQRRIKKKSEHNENAEFPDVEFYQASCESLPFEKETFDVVVTTFVICSVENIRNSLTEIKRVLKPEGRYLFFEHGQSDKEGVKKWQKRLDPIHKFYADGCRLSVNMKEEIEGAGFQISGFESYDLQYFPRILGHIYTGAARVHFNTH